jgi:hypothetical protein
MLRYTKIIRTYSTTYIPCKKKYLQPCLEQRRHFFTTFIVSVDSLIGKEAKTVLKVLVSRTATKAVNTYLNVMGYNRARLSRATHVCLRGSRWSPDVANEQQTSTAGGYGREFPPQILIKRRS